MATPQPCSSGNQPQMRSEALAAAAQKFTFDFVRATNLESPAAGHMGQLVLTVEDHDHFTQEWSWMKMAKSPIVRFSISRARADAYLTEGWARSVVPSGLAFSRGTAHPHR